MKRSLLIAFLSLGMVSLFADICYEGMRSVLGSYIEYSGLPILFAGAVSAAEFVGYLTRFASGLIATGLRSAKIYWGLVYAGYLTNLAVPLLALTSRWDLIITLIFVERVGKGLRTPVRDVILAEVTEGMGKGKGFGIHELLDQVGAFIGPLFVAWALYSTNSYSYAYSILAVPVLISLLFLTVAYMNYPQVRAVMEAPRHGSIYGKTPHYFLAVSAFFFGFMPWSIIAYHISFSGVLPDYQIAIAYSIAMAADAITAVPIGLLYDKVGLKSLLLTPLIALLIPITLTSADPLMLPLTATFWGIAMAAYETTMRAALADLVEPSNRAIAYGAFNLAVGASWMLGSLSISYLYGMSWYSVVGLITLSEITALILLLFVVKSHR